MKPSVRTRLLASTTARRPPRQIVRKVSEGPDRITDVINRRDAAVRSLDRSLAHKSRLDLIAIITSFIQLTDLESLAKFQNRK